MVSAFRARERVGLTVGVTSAIQRAGAQDTTVRRTMTRRGDERDGICVMMKHALLERQILLNNMNMSAHTFWWRGEDKQSCRLSSRDSTLTFGTDLFALRFQDGRVHQSHRFSATLLSPTSDIR